MNDIEIKIKRLSKDAVIPSYAHDEDVCMDLTAISVEYDKEKDMYKYHTGLCIESERNYGILLFPRSSNNRTDAYLCNHVGVVDSSIYKGEIVLCFKNRDSWKTRLTLQALEQAMYNIRLNTTVDNNGSSITQRTSIINDFDAILYNNMEHRDPMEAAPYKVGDRIAQMLVFDYKKAYPIEVDDIGDSERGEGGFGSSGE